MQLNEKLSLFDVQQCIINHCIKCYSDSIFKWHSILLIVMSGQFAWQLTSLPVINFLVAFICLSVD